METQLIVRPKLLGSFSRPRRRMVSRKATMEASGPRELGFRLYMQLL